MQLWENVKILCTVGIVTNADPDKVQRDADFRFSRVHQYASESVSGFYDRYLQEVARGQRPGLLPSSQRTSQRDAEIEKENVQVRAIRARIRLKSEKKRL